VIVVLGMMKLKLGFDCFSGGHDLEMRSEWVDETCPGKVEAVVQCCSLARRLEFFGRWKRDASARIVKKTRGMM